MNCKVFIHLVLTGALVAGLGAAAPAFAGQTKTTTGVAVDDSTLHDRIHEAIEKDSTLKN